MTFLKHHWFGLILSLFMLAYLLVFVLVLLSPRYDMQKRGFIPCTEAMAERLIDCDNGAWCMLKTIVRNGWCDAEVIGGGFRMWLRGEQKRPGQIICLNRSSPARTTSRKRTKACASFMPKLRTLKLPCKISAA